MNKVRQNLIYLVILILVSAAMWMINPQIQIKSHGVLLPTGISSPSVKVSHVQVLGHFPAKYQSLGEIRTTKHFETLSNSEQNQNEKDNLALARSLAAKAGASAIVVTMLGRSGQNGPLDGTVLYAKAIKQS